jgi:HD-GYP domain-containing protein (c-di-GMP phosphodiesterase class II)
LWPFAVVATLGVVLFPLLVVLILREIGLPDPEALVAAVVCLVLSIGAAAFGTAIWTRRSESIDVAFGELMLWRFLRRHKAERTIDEGAVVLGLGPDWSLRNGQIDIDPDRALDTLQRLTGALEAKDPYTHGHSRRVERHVHRTAMAMGLSSEEIRDLRIAASLHDVGKIRVPSRILRKPEALDDSETRVMRDHVHVGAAMVATAATPEVTNAILHHHEYWNGTGYPMGLTHTEIPLFARVIAVADTYDALTSARPYKSGCGRREAIDVLRSGAGVQFDPEVVDAFISTLPAALPAVSALLVFVRPERLARRVVSWTRSSAVGSVSTGAVAAGSAAAVITAGMLFPSAPGGPSSQGNLAGPGSKPPAVELVEAASDEEPAADVRKERAKESLEHLGPQPSSGLRTSEVSTDADAPENDDVEVDSSAAEPDDEGNGHSNGPAPDDGPNGGPNGHGPNGHGPDGHGPPGHTPPGDDDDDPVEPTPEPPDDDDDGDDDEGEDCDDKKGQGHDSHGQGHGHGHDHHCGE